MSAEAPDTAPRGDAGGGAGGDEGLAGTARGDHARAWVLTQCVGGGRDGVLLMGAQFEGVL